MAKPSSDSVFGNLVQFLVDGHELDTANLLMSCSFEYWEGDCVDPALPEFWTVFLSCPRSAYDGFNNTQLPYRQQFESACEAVFAAYGAVLHDLKLSAALVDMAPDWREELIGIARGNSIHNQIGTRGEGVRT